MTDREMVWHSQGRERNPTTFNKKTRQIALAGFFFHRSEKDQADFAMISSATLRGTGS
ncbi:hypothetical protein Gbth_002_099 [Gluconobacter thailandicus F149-1 = NBRC 100600]|nr:hypothetical protein Gbth_002_099 [Gluconobacter thailandicus F149-1 = NBRC 100600]GBR59124.1 hypothetical protein AA100600_1148 [Gluconobacter thailandicus F149-1 = NBRC 100600]